MFYACIDLSRLIMNIYFPADIAIQLFRLWVTNTFSLAVDAEQKHLFSHLQSQLNKHTSILYILWIVQFSIFFNHSFID